MGSWAYQGTYTGNTGNIQNGTVIAVGVSRVGELPAAGTYTITGVECYFSKIRFGGDDTAYGHDWHKYILLNEPVGEHAASLVNPAGVFQAPFNTGSAGIEFFLDSTEMSLTAHDYRNVTSVAVYRGDNGNSVGLINGCAIRLTITYVYNFSPVTPPTAVSVSKLRPLTGENVTLSWSGAQAGVNNPIGSYEVYRAPSAGGAYGYLTTATGTSCTVAAPTGNGQSFFYKVKAKATAGAGYDSGLSGAYASLTAYAAPSAPAIPLPAWGAVARSTAVRVRLTIGAAPDGGGMTLLRSIDGAGYVSLGAASAGTRYDDMTLGAGTHTIRYKLRDGRGCESGEGAVAVTVATVLWRRAIAVGTVIASAQISHRADIAQMLSEVNAMRAYAGLGAMALPGTVGRFSDWKSQMTALEKGIDGARAAMGLSGLGWASVPGYPSASVVNEIRRAVSGTISIDPSAPPPPDPPAPPVTTSNGVTDEAGNLITDESGNVIIFA